MSGARAGSPLCRVGSQLPVIISKASASVSVGARVCARIRWWLERVEPTRIGWGIKVGDRQRRDRDSERSNSSGSNFKTSISTGQPERRPAPKASVALENFRLAAEVRRRVARAFAAKAPSRRQWWANARTNDQRISRALERERERERERVAAHTFIYLVILRATN